jgi:predicted DNA-binding transcriptional regulator AlpA
MTLADQWISTREAAALLGVAESTVYRWLADESVRKEVWGAEGVGWRYRPVLRRRIYQVSLRRVNKIAAGANAADKD